MSLSLQACPCCFMPVVMLAFLAFLAVLLLSKAVSFVFNLIWPSTTRDNGIVNRVFGVVSVVVTVAVTLVAIFLGVLSRSPELRAKFFVALCSVLSKSPDMDSVRCQHIQKVHGRVLELGPGPGTNFRCWQNSEIEEWVGIEPNHYFTDNLKQQQDKYNLTFPTQLVWLKGEDVDVEPSSFDFVVGTHVLCSVSDVTQVLKQIDRALKPGGKYLFLEHVTAAHIPEESTIAWFQSMMAPLLRVIGNGCEFRELWKDLKEGPLATAGFDVSLEHFNAEIPLPPLAPHIKGQAVKPLTT